MGDFPKNEDEMEYWNEVHKDYDFKCKAKDVDPHKLLKEIKAERLTNQDEKPK